MAGTPAVTHVRGMSAWNNHAVHICREKGPRRVLHKDIDPCAAPACKSYAHSPHAQHRCMAGTPALIHRRSMSAWSIKLAEIHRKKLVSPPIWRFRRSSCVCVWVGRWLLWPSMSIRQLCIFSTPIHRLLFLAVNQRSSSPYRHPKVCPALARSQHAPARMVDARFQYGREKRNHWAVRLTWVSRPSADTGCEWRMLICAHTSQHTDMHAPPDAANHISTTQIIN